MLLAQRQVVRGPVHHRSCKPFGLGKVTAPVPLRTSHIVRAEVVDEGEELEKRLARLKQLKRGDRGTKSKLNEPVQAEAPVKKVYDYTGEVVHYEGSPSKGDLAVNVALGATLLWLPLTIAAITRALFVSYVITDKRITVTTQAPWKSESSTIPMEDVKEVVAVGRGLGLWGDMVLTLKNGDKVEMRSVDKFRELQQYIMARRDALNPSENVDPMDEGGQAEAKAGKRPGTKGFA